MARQHNGPLPARPEVNIVVKGAARPTRILVRPTGASKSWSGTPLPARRSGDPVNQALVVSRAPSPGPRLHPVMSQFKNDMAYAMYKLRRRGRHVERDIAKHYTNVRQIAWDHAEKDMYGGRFHRKCLKHAGEAKEPPSSVFSPRSTMTTGTGSNVTTPRVARSVAGIGCCQSRNTSNQRSGIFRPSVDRDILPPVD